MKVIDVIGIFTECRDRSVASQLFHDASIWRALMERLAELNELDPEVAKQKTTLLAMALRDASDLLLKCSGASESNLSTVRVYSNGFDRHGDCGCDWASSVHGEHGPEHDPQ